MDKRTVDTEHVRITTSVAAEQVVVRDTVARGEVEIRHVVIGREVSHAPAIREEDGVTIIPIIEERLVVEKRLFLIEEIHVVRTNRTEAITLPTTLRRTRIDIDRTDLTNMPDDVHGRTE